MPDDDHLSFNIAFALMQKTSGATKKALRSLPEGELDRLADIIAAELRLCGWRRLPPTPLARADQFPGAGSQRSHDP